MNHNVKFNKIFPSIRIVADFQMIDSK